MADLGFPVGGRGPRRRGMDSRGGYVSKILYVRTKESGPLEGRALGAPPISANEIVKSFMNNGVKKACKFFKKAQE